MTEEVKSGIYIEFDAPFNVNFSQQIFGMVSPLQIIAVCEALTLKSKQEVLMEIEKQRAELLEKSKIETPNKKLIIPS